MGIQALVEMLKEFSNDNSRREEELLNSIAENNNNVMPTIDGNVRYHAPVNGYVWNDSVYAAGEYLSLDSIKTGYNSSAKVKVKTNSLQTIKDVWPSISNGKTWSEDDVEVTYCYINDLTKAQSDKIAKAFPYSSHRVLMSVEQAQDEGITLGSTWKFNMRGLSSAWKEACSCSACDEVWFLELHRMGIKESDVKITITKAGKTKISHPLKGLEVGYYYHKVESL